MIIGILRWDWLALITSFAGATASAHGGRRLFQDKEFEMKTIALATLWIAWGAAVFALLYVFALVMLMH